MLLIARYGFKTHERNSVEISQSNRTTHHNYRTRAQVAARTPIPHLTITRVWTLLTFLTCRICDVQTCAAPARPPPCPTSAPAPRSATSSHAITARAAAQPSQTCSVMCPILQTVSMVMCSRRSSCRRGSRRNERACTGDISLFCHSVKWRHSVMSSPCIASYGPLRRACDYYYGTWQCYLCLYWACSLAMSNYGIYSMCT